MDPSSPLDPSVPPQLLNVRASSLPDAALPLVTVSWYTCDSRRSTGFAQQHSNHTHNPLKDQGGGKEMESGTRTQAAQLQTRRVTNQCITQQWWASKNHRTPQTSYARSQRITPLSHPCSQIHNFNHFMHFIILSHPSGAEVLV